MRATPRGAQSGMPRAQSGMSRALSLSKRRTRGRMPVDKLRARGRGAGQGAGN